MISLYHHHYRQEDASSSWLISNLICMNCLRSSGGWSRSHVFNKFIFLHYHLAFPLPNHHHHSEKAISLHGFNFSFCITNGPLCWSSFFKHHNCHQVHNLSSLSKSTAFERCLNHFLNHHPVMPFIINAIINLCYHHIYKETRRQSSSSSSALKLFSNRFNLGHCTKW